MLLGAPLTYKIKSQLLCQLSYAPAVRGGLPAASRRFRIGENNAPSGRNVALQANICTNPARQRVATVRI